nr:Rep [Trichosanthes kirilowii geminiviridae]
MPGQRRNEFRFEGKYVFLTYPRCELRPHTVHDELHERYPIKYFCIASEEHEEPDDEGIILHIHAVIEFVDTVRTRNAEAFNIQGFHPNIQRVRSRKAACDYVRKDGDFISNFPDASKTTWGDILAQSTTKDEFLDSVRSHYPRDYVLQHDRVLSFAELHFKPTIPEYVNEYNFANVDPRLTDWCNDNLVDNVGTQWPQRTFREAS